MNEWVSSRKTRELGSLTLLGVGLLLACSVDTGGITFEKDDVFQRHAEDGGAANIAGVANVGGVVNIAGVLNKGGTDAKAGSSNGGRAGNGSGGMMPNGGMGMGGMAGMPPECGTGQANAAQPLIDDFEDGDPVIAMMSGRSGGWYIYNDGTGVQMPAADKPPIPEMGGAMGSKLAMHTLGKGFTVFGAVVGAPFQAMMAGGPPCTYDVKPQKGVRFWAKTGIMASVLRVQIATLASHQPEQGGACNPNVAPMGACGDHYGLDFPLQPNWKQFEAPFMAMAQEGWGKKVSFDPDNAMNIEFKAPANTDFDFWIDTVEFY